MALITLRILDGADRGRTYSQLPTPVTIGREEGNSVQLNDERVSRFHLKIQEDQDKVVLTDLDSTNGTKVNGEDTHLRILRHGDVIVLGRSVLVYGTPEQIAARLASLRAAKAKAEGEGTVKDDPDSPSVEAHSLDFEIGWSAAEPFAIVGTLEAPELPDNLSPCQGAQLSELLEYLHIRIRHLLESVATTDKEERVTLDHRHWQGLIDLQGKLASYLRAIGRPNE